MESNLCCEFDNLELFRKKKIIIIGAGISGLACALHLKELGFINICVLEARDRIGGRMHTIHDGPHFTEMGAQWIHGEENNIIYEMASSNDLVDKAAVDYIDMIWSFENAAKEEKEMIYLLTKYLRERIDNIPVDGCTNMSVLSYLDKLFQSFVQDIYNDSLKYCLHEVFDWFCKLQCELNGCCSLSFLSSKLLGTYKDCDGCPTVELKYGYSSILNLFLRNIPNDWILKNHCVTKIDWSELFDQSTSLTEPKNAKSVKVSCDNGKKYFADHVIITLPLGYLKKYSQTLFYPCLSKKKQQAINCLGFDAVNKIFLYFDVPFWKKHSVVNVFWKKEFDEHFTTESVSYCRKVPSQHWVKSIIRFAYTPSHPQMLCVWVSGVGAVTVESLSDDDVLNDCMKLLQLLLKEELPKPSKILRSSWHSDPFTCGSYSYQSIECEKENISPSDLAEPEWANSLCSKHPVLLFAGEASHECYFSTVHGACETGFREAKRLFCHYSNKERKQMTYGIHSMSYEMSKLLTCKKSWLTDLKVVIIGAGISGLACAAHLINKKFSNIKILEAQNRIGGRVHSISYGDGFLELGAQWIHGTQNELYSFSKANGILPDVLGLTYEGKGTFYTSSGNKIPSEEVEEVKKVLNETKTKLENGYFKSNINKSILSIFREDFDVYVNKKNNKSDIAVKQGLFDWYIKFEVIDNSCDCLDSVAVQSYTDWEDCPLEEYHISFDKGFSSLIDTLASKIPCESIYLNKPVTKICWNENFKHGYFLESNFHSHTYDTSPVCLECEDGENVSADCVILTSSIGFLKENLTTFFNPPLPANKSKAIEKIGFGTINKFYLIYSKAFWSQNDVGIQLVWMPEKTSECKMLLLENPWICGITGFDIIEKQPNVLLGWIGGEEAKLMEDVKEDDISSACTKLFKIFLNRPDIPCPIKIFRSQWYKNPYIKGAYSNRTMNYYQSNLSLYDLQHPLSANYSTKKKTKVQWPLVIFAGEAFDENFFSAAHGAFRSGLKAAESIIESCSEIEVSNE